MVLEIFVISYNFFILLKAGLYIISICSPYTQKNSAPSGTEFFILNLCFYLSTRAIAIL